MQGIYVDMSKCSNKDDDDYLGDISEIMNLPVDIVTQEEIDADPFGGAPVPYFCRDVEVTIRLKKLIDPQWGLTWSIVPVIIQESESESEIPKIIVVFMKPRNYKIMDFVELEKLYLGGNPKATQIVKLHKIWGCAIFFRVDHKPLTRDFFIKTYVLPSRLPAIKVPVLEGDPHGEEERYKYAQRYLELLISHHIISYETAYVLFGTQIMYEYVQNARPFFMGGGCFHALFEYANILLSLDAGITPDEKNTSETNPIYLYEAQNVTPILPVNYETIKDKVIEYYERKGLVYEVPIIYEEIRRKNAEAKRLIFLRSTIRRKYMKFLSKGEKHKLTDPDVEFTAIQLQKMSEKGIRGKKLAYLKRNRKKLDPTDVAFLRKYNISNPSEKFENIYLAFESH